VRRMSHLARIWAAAATIAAPGLRLMLRLRLARGKELPGRLPERRGIDATPRPPGRLLWLHAASVGETTSVLPVLAPLLARAPDLTVLFSTGTVTAAQLLAQRLAPDQAARVMHRFVPLDVPAWAGRFLDHWRPDAAAFLESELWPNIVLACHARSIRLMLLNARLSPRSFARWQRVPGLAGALLGGFDLIHARSESDAARLGSLGARRIKAPGDLKIAAPPLPCDPGELARLQVLLADRPTWLAASTHQGEEALIFAVHRVLAAQFPDLLTIVAPRHPERWARIRRQQQGSGLRIRWGNWACGTGWCRSHLSAAACLHPAVGRIRWSRHVSAAPWRSGRIPGISTRISRCCRRQARWRRLRMTRHWHTSSRRCWGTSIPAEPPDAARWLPCSDRGMWWSKRSKHYGDC